MLKLPLNTVLVACTLTGCLLSSNSIAAGGTIHHWITDDGTYAFTDDAKHIPSRYRPRVVSKTLKELHNYERFTPVETAKVVERVPAAPSHELRAIPSTACGTGQGAPQTISLHIGGDDAPVIDITPGEGEEPIVIERQRYKPAGAMVTRSNLIVRQGDRILTVVKPQSREINVNEFGDEEDLER